MKGEILDYSNETGSGLILGTDGIRYTFAGDQWRGSVPHKNGQQVDFDAAGDQATSIYPLATGSPPSGQSTPPPLPPPIQAGAFASGNQASAPNQVVASNPPKDPILAGVLSGCCIIGLGQIMLGQVVKGIAILVVGIILAAVTGGFAAPIIWIVAGVDAYLIGKKLKEGKMVGQWDFF